MGRKNDCLGLIVLFVFGSNVMFGQAISEFTKGIHTVLFYGKINGESFNAKYKNSPIVSLSGRDQLFLEFDDLDAKHKQYIAKIIHLDESGKESNISEMMYLKGFNEYIINDYAVSQGPKEAYYHYAIQIPKPKISGAFILKLFESNEVLMQRRFYVFEPKVGLSANVSPAQDGVKWRTHHQLNIEFSLGAYFVSFPQEELVLKVIKNHDPLSVRTISNKYLRRNSSNKWAYKNFDDEDLVLAGNEFRFIDISDRYAKGQNIDFFENNTFYSNVQNSRERQNYVQSFDQNGAFVSHTLDGNNPDLTAAYYKVKLRLNAPKAHEKVWLHGKLCNWEPTEMVLNDENLLYEVELNLKQGVYDFAFETQGLDLEGSHAETRNTYEFLLFQKIPGKSFNSLISYSRIEN